MRFFTPPVRTWAFYGDGTLKEVRICSGEVDEDGYGLFEGYVHHQYALFEECCNAKGFIMFVEAETEAEALAEVEKNVSR